jgi:site-specific recombinase XerD
MELIKLKESQAHFFQHLESKGKSFNTIKNYRSDLECFNHYLIEVKKNLKLESFEPKEAQVYGQYLEKKYSSSNSIRRRIQALRLFFDYLVSLNKWDHNPIKSITTSPKKLFEPIPVHYSMILKLDSALKESSLDPNFNGTIALRNRVLFHLIYGSALKVSDIALLKTKDLILHKKNPRVMIKNSQQETISVPLMPSSVPLIEKYLPYTVDDFLLFNANAFKAFSGGLSPRGVELIFKNLSRQFKTSLTARSLRLSCIYRWLMENKNESTIKEWMGVAPDYSLSHFKEIIQKSPELTFFQSLENE